MRIIVKQNNEFIATNCVTTKIVDRNIRIERIVPQIHEKIVEVERIIERPSRDLILALTEKEKSELRKSVKEEYRQRLKEMEANILAYQELLLQKQNEIKAYAFELAALQLKQKDGGCSEQVHAKLEESLIQKQQIIEQLTSKQLNGDQGMTEKVHKKLEHINAKFAEKLALVHEEYRKLMLEQSNKYEDEIKDIEVEKKRALENAQLTIDDIIKRTNV